MPCDTGLITSRIIDGGTEAQQVLLAKGHSTSN